MPNTSKILSTQLDSVGTEHNIWPSKYIHCSASLYVSKSHNFPFHVPSVARVYRARNSVAVDSHHTDRTGKAMCKLQTLLFQV
jgi:hypothetical protein